MRRRASRARGFTLLEVMIGLALLGLALTVLIKSAAGSIFNARQAQMTGVVTDLARGKMYDLEEQLLKDGFSETGLADAEDACTDFESFEDEGWPSVRWCAKIEQVELPSFDQLQAMSQASAPGAGSGSALPAGVDGELPAGGFQDSALGGMLSMLGGGFGGGDSGANIDAQVGASFIQGQYTMVQEVLKVSIRKVSLYLEWDVMGSKREMQVVGFFTDAAAMDKVLQGLGSQDLDDQPANNNNTGNNNNNNNSGTGRTGGSTRGGTTGGDRK